MDSLYLLGTDPAVYLVAFVLVFLAGLGAGVGWILYSLTGVDLTPDEPIAFK